MQALWQIYLPAPRYIPRPKFNVSLPNAVHQADLLFLPHDKLPHGRKVYKHALTVVDVASRYKAAEPLTSKESDEVSKAFKEYIKKGPLKWPQLLQVDPGREFIGAVTKVVTKPEEAVMYYLFDGPKRGFVREELMVVPPDTQLPPANALRLRGFHLATPNASHRFPWTSLRYIGYVPVAVSLCHYAVGLDPSL